MSLAISAQGTTLEVATGSGSPITTVTAAVGNPTIITKTSHGLSNGDVVTLSAFAGASAALMNGETVIVHSVTTNTLAVDIDTTGGTLTAANGTLTPVTFTAIEEVKSFSGLDGAASEVDVTHLASTAKEFRLGLKDEGGFSFEVNRVPGGVGQDAVFTSRSAGTVKSYRLTFPNAETVTFDALTKTFTIAGGVDGVISHSVSLRVTGEAVYA